MRTLSLLEKWAVISAEEHAQALADGRAKQLELAALRGQTPPMKSVATGYNPTTGEYTYEQRPDLDNFRSSGRTNLDSDGVLNRRVMSEAETIKSHIPGADSNLQRLKHRWLLPAKRFMGSTPGKLLAGGAALGAAGLGIGHYLKTQRTPQPENYQLSPEQQQEYADQMYPKMGAYMNAAFTPAPVAPPKVTAPGPAVGNLKSKTPGLGAKPLISPIGAPGTGISAPKATKKAELDPTLAAVLGGGVGGGLGYLAGSQVVNPLLARSESSVVSEIASKQQTLKRLQFAKEWAPIGIAALGAVALASMAAARARHDERQRMQYAQYMRDYDPNNSGYGATEQVPMGAPANEVFG